MSISRSIVEAVRSLEPPGRFLEKNPQTGLWSDIGHKKAVEKTSQALRDGAASLRKQLSADFGDPDFLNAVFDVDDSKEDKDKQKKKKREDIKDSMDMDDSKGEEKKTDDPDTPREFKKEKEKIKLSDKGKPQKVSSVPSYLHLFLPMLSNFLQFCSSTNKISRLRRIYVYSEQVASQERSQTNEVESLFDYCQRCKIPKAKTIRHPIVTCPSWYNDILP